MGAVIERPADQRRGRVVDDQRDTELFADPRHSPDRERHQLRVRQGLAEECPGPAVGGAAEGIGIGRVDEPGLDAHRLQGVGEQVPGRSEEHTSELQSLMRISYAVFCLKKKIKDTRTNILYSNNIYTLQRYTLSSIQ